MQTADVVKPSPGESVLSRVVRIFETFESDVPALRVSEIARRAGLHVATASRLVEELVRHGWLHRDADRRIRIGVRIWELASRASPTLTLRDAAMPFMEDLHAVVGHHTQLGVLEGKEVLFVERLSAPGAVLNITRVAGRLPLNVSSSGLVLLAHAPAELRDEVLAGPLKAYRGAAADSVTLRRTLADIRKNGYAFCPGFVDEETTGIAVPVRRAGQVIAALAVIVPNDGNARTQIPALLAAARGVSRVLSAEDLSH
jgi:DNA-binding IclR family transcriptional regulator